MSPYWVIGLCLSTKIKSKYHQSQGQARDKAGSFIMANVKMQCENILPFDVEKHE